MGFNLQVAHVGDFDRPVDLSRIMTKTGIPLGAALEFINELSSRRKAAALFVLDNASALVEDIEKLGLQCSIVSQL